MLLYLARERENLRESERDRKRRRRDRRAGKEAQLCCGWATAEIKGVGRGRWLDLAGEENEEELDWGRSRWGFGGVWRRLRGANDLVLGFGPYLD